MPQLDGVDLKDTTICQCGEDYSHDGGALTNQGITILIS